MKKLFAVILSAIVWVISATALNLFCLLLFKSYIGPDSGGRDEVLRNLSAAGIAGVVTVFAIIVLVKKGWITAAITTLITSILIGGYYLFVIMAFGAEYLF